MQRDSLRLEPLVDEAVTTIRTIFQPGKHTGEEIVTAKIAGGVLATWSRLKQSERAQEALYFTMASALAEDKEQLTKYMQITLPGVPLVEVLERKTLPKPKGK